MQRDLKVISSSHSGNCKDYGVLELHVNGPKEMYHHF